LAASGLINHERLQQELAANRNEPDYFEWRPNPLGFPGPGLPTLTQRLTRFLPPQPELEQGVGRSPGLKWAHYSTQTGVNHYWYLGVGIVGSTPPEAGPLPMISGLGHPSGVGLSLAFYEQQILRQRELGGLTSVPITVPQPPTRSQTELRRIYPPGYSRRYRLR
jgi:hypothetical protein